MILVGKVEVQLTHVPFEGTDRRYRMTGHSVVTWNGRDIPYAPTDFSKYKPSGYLKSSDATHPVMGMWQSFYEAYQKAADDKMIPLEKAHSNILMIAGEEDEDWPSAYSVEKLKARLADQDYKGRVESILYPHVGHLTGMMPNREREKLLYRMLPIVGMAYKTLGKYKKESLEAFAKSEKAIIDFIK